MRLQVDADIQARDIGRPHSPECQGAMRLGQTHSICSDRSSNNEVILIDNQLPPCADWESVTYALAGFGDLRGPAEGICQAQLCSLRIVLVSVNALSYRPSPPLSQSPPQQRDTQTGLGVGPDLEHTEASIQLKLQTSPFWRIHISAGFAVASELFNFA